MSDPLQTTRTTINLLELSAHPLQPLSMAQIHKLLPKEDKLQDRERAAAKIERARLDVSMQRARLASAEWSADGEVLKRLGGAKKGEVWLASSTAGMDVRMPLPRLLKVTQEVYDALPETALFPGVKAAVKKAVPLKAYVGGGAHLSLNRLIEHGPKRGDKIRAPPSLDEVRRAMAKTGRTFVSVERRELAWDGREKGVEFNADADNGFPVGMNMHDKYARELVLKLAGGLRSRLELAPDKEAGARLLRDRMPEMATFKGKAKTDLYGVAKVSSGQLRFYNTGGRQLVLIMQQATQPLSEAWKENSAKNYRSFLGKGMARGGADGLVTWLERELQTRELVWTHAGDDTMLVRAEEILEGTWRYEMFSLDCTAFDLTQHADTTVHVHREMGDQLTKVDSVSGALWHTLMRERDVTVSGALVVRTRHWGASGMPLQSEVNDVLMEVLCERLGGHKWDTKEQLAGIIEREGQDLGFKVRLEDYWSILSSKAQPNPLRWCLSKRPFLFVGYHLWTDAENVVQAQIDVCRFMSGMPFLGGTYEKDAAATGVRAALVLAGYALSFGVPSPRFEPAYQVLASNAIEAVTNKAREINMLDANAEIQRHVYAGLGLSVESAQGLVSAIGRSREIWGKPAADLSELPELDPVAQWADEPELEDWEREFLAPLSRLDFGVQKNEVQAVGQKLAGTLPPTPASVLHDRQVLKDAMRAREDAVEKAHYKGKGRKRDKRSGVVVSEDPEDEYLGGLYEPDD